MRSYLDYAAGAPLRPEVERAMQKAPQGNPGSLHQDGQESSAAVFAARRSIAKSLGLAKPDAYKHIIFTGSATEANNLVLRGTLKAVHSNLSLVKSDPLPSRFSLLASNVEHESIQKTAQDLSSEAHIKIIPVSKKGFINPADIQKELSPESALVSVIGVQNEIGTIQPIAEIGKLIAEYRRDRVVSRKSLVVSQFLPLFHSDASQMVAYTECNPENLGVDFLTISPHKFGGPKGIGILYIKNPAILSPITTGGGQEEGLRSGTENVAAIIGAAKALERAAEERDKKSTELTKEKKRLFAGIKKAFPKAEENGGSPSAPNILDVYIPGQNAHELVIAFDLLGVACAAGPACSSRRSEPSATLRAMGLGEKRASESIRFSMGWGTTKEDIAQAIKAATIIAARSRRR